MADAQPDLKEIRHELSEISRFGGGAGDSYIFVFCKKMDIPYDDLASEDFTNG